MSALLRLDGSREAVAANPVNRDMSLLKPAIVGLVIGALISAVLVWRDLNQRDDDQVRGARARWRVFKALNARNSHADWAIGPR